VLKAHGLVPLFGCFVFMFLVGMALAGFSRRHIYPVFAVGREYAVEPCSTVFGFRVNPIQEQHMEMYIEIERTAEPLDQRHRTGLRGLSSESCLLNQPSSFSCCLTTSRALL
jgi:hypothetical protein